MDRQCLCSSLSVQLNREMTRIILEFEKKKKKKAVALLESVGEPSSDHEGELMQR